MSNHDKWYGWVPINRGRLDFQFISRNNLRIITKHFSSSLSSTLKPKQIIVNGLNVSKLSCSDNFSYFGKTQKPNYKEIESFADIIINDNGEYFEGIVRL